MFLLPIVAFIVLVVLVLVVAIVWGVAGSKREE